MSGTTDVVIAAAAPHAGALSMALCHHCPPPNWARSRSMLITTRVYAKDVSKSFWAGSDSRYRTEPGASGSHFSRHPGRPHRRDYQSGLRLVRAVAMGYQAILAGDSDIVVAGGRKHESGHHCAHLKRAEDGRSGSDGDDQRRIVGCF